MGSIKDLISSKISERSQNNISTAKEKCAQAKKLLGQYNSVNDKQLINQALDLYKGSIELYSKLVDAYIGVAYISYSAGKLKEAIGYLNTAMDIEPGNSEVSEMVNELLKEWEKKRISDIISKESKKSLSGKLSENTRPNASITEKLSSLIFSRVAKKSKNPDNIPTDKKNTNTSLSNTKENNTANNERGSAKSDFFDLINKAKSGSNK